MIDLHLINKSIIYRLIEVSTKKGRVAHFCKIFLFFFRLIPRSTEKILDLFLIISFSFHFSKEINHSNSYKRRIISNFWRRRDTYGVTIQFFGWCKNHLKSLTNQNKRYAITLINIKWFIYNLYCFLSIMKRWLLEQILIDFKLIGNYNLQSLIHLCLSLIKFLFMDKGWFLKFHVQRNSKFYEWPFEGCVIVLLINSSIYHCFKLTGWHY